MDYELATQLQNAGFPQSGDGKRIGSPNAVLWRSNDLAYEPTLDELFQAVGDEFIRLLKRHDGTFLAESSSGAVAEGSTADEAMARLWLALHR